MKVLISAFYFDLFEVHYCVLHTQDVFSGTASDTRAQDNYHANAYCEPAVKSDTLNF
jgi:hypothetical protein